MYHIIYVYIISINHIQYKNNGKIDKKQSHLTKTQPVACVRETHVFLVDTHDVRNTVFPTMFCEIWHPNQSNNYARMHMDKVQTAK